MGTMPVDSSAIWVNAPVERSMQFEFSHVGQASAMVTVTLLPLSVLMICAFLPQSEETSPVLP